MCFLYVCEMLVGLGGTKGLVVKCVSAGAVYRSVMVKNSVYVGAEMMSHVIPA